MPSAGAYACETAVFLGVSITIQIAQVYVPDFATGSNHSEHQMEDRMPTFLLSLNWTDQGIRSVKDSPKRAQAARDLAKKVGVEIKEVYLTSGASDLLLILDAPNGDNVTKFALALGSQGNVRTTTARAWRETEFQKIIAELP